MRDPEPVATRLSHHIRTPMTRLRLRLEELLLVDDLPDAAAAGLALALGDLDELARAASTACRELGDPAPPAAAAR